jgi:hypothetical protein
MLAAVTRTHNLTRSNPHTQQTTRLTPTHCSMQQCTGFGCLVEPAGTSTLRPYETQVLLTSTLITDMRNIM